MTTTTLDLDGRDLVRGIAVSEVIAAGIDLDATTDSDVGPENCRISASLDTDLDGRYGYAVWFRQATLPETLAGRGPAWRMDRRSLKFGRQIERLFTAAEREEIEAARNYTE